VPPSREDFIRWQDDNVTRWVMAAHRKTAEDNKAAWLTQSWESGHSNPLTLLELRTRSDAYLAIADMTYADVCAALGDAPNEE
jgi:hypothetical protein